MTVEGTYWPGRRRAAGVVAFISVMLVAGPAIAGFIADDVEVWVGSGSNEAVLVIDWNDGLAPESLAWGFRWDGLATGADMFNAIVSADPRVHQIAGGGGPGTIFGLGYDLDDDGFGYQPGPDETGVASDPDDHYQEGWFTAGFWSYFTADGPGSPFDGGPAFESSFTGFADRMLMDGSWDAWVFDAGFSFAVEPGEPAAAAAIPAPAAGFCMISGVVLGGTRRRRMVG